MPVPLVSCFTFRPSRISEAWRVRLHVLYWFYEKKLKYCSTYPGKSFRIMDTIPQSNTTCIPENGCLEDSILFFLGQMAYFQRRCLLVLQNVIPPYQHFGLLRHPCITAQPGNRGTSLWRPWGVWNGRESAYQKGGFKNIPARKPIWQWKITIFDRRYIFNFFFFHCHVRFRGCKLQDLSNMGHLQMSNMCAINFGP